MPKEHTVASGETISQIAQRNGFQDWRLVWNASGNQSLRSLRGTPERIRPGDKVEIPDLKEKTHPVAPGGTHQFQLKASEPLELLEVGVFDKRQSSVALKDFKLVLRLPGASTDTTHVVPANGIVRVEGASVTAGAATVVDLFDDRADPLIRYKEVQGRELETGKSHQLLVADKRAVADAIAAAHGMERRSDWSAAPPKKELDPAWDYTTIVIHHLGNNVGKSPKEIQDYQMNQSKDKFDDIAYEYVVQLTGKVSEGRHIAFLSAANSGQNTGKLAIILAGDFEHQWHDRTDDDVTEEGLNRIVGLVETLKLYFPLTQLIGHLDIVPDRTECPGSELYKRLPELRTRTGLAGP
jgi:hypothetical protein